jgi:hypothetical protein
MPSIPPEAVRLALAARADLLADRPDPMVLSEETLTRLMLEAAAPALAEAVAQKILAHAERQFPKADHARVPGRPDVWRTWHRHFGIAARVAAGAFDTREDQLRMTVDAINRGDFIACDIPEVPREVEEDEEP